MKQEKMFTMKKIAVFVLIVALLAICGCGAEAVNPDINSTSITEGTISSDNQIAETAEDDGTTENNSFKNASTMEKATDHPSATVIFYGAGGGDLQWELCDSVLSAMFGLYNTSGINYIVVLGGQNEWPTGYLTDLLNTNDGENVNRTGWFHINVEAVSEKLDEIAEEFGIDPLDIERKSSSDEDDGLLDRLYQELFCETCLPQVEGSEITLEYPIEDGRTLERALKIARNQYCADDYYITFSGHGTGSMGGICYAEKSREGTDDHLSIPALDQAFHNAGFGDDLKLVLLAFDACGMGGIELGVRLSNYYKYMIASEVCQWGGLNQCVLVRSIVDNRTKENPAYCVAQDVHERKYNDSKNGEPVQTSALFFGPKGNAAATAIDNAASQLLKASHQDEHVKVDIYDALKKATMYCYSNYDAPDGRDLFTSLLRTLHEKGITQFDQVIQGAISGINDFMIDNWYSFDSRPLYNSLEGGIISENAEYREKYMDHDLCGGTVCAINYPKFTQAYSADSAEDFSQNGTDTIKNFDDNYYQRYKDYGFENYAQLMKEYAEYFLQEDFYFSNQNLAGDLADPAGADYQDITDICWSDDTKAVRLEILDYDNAVASDSSGDSLVDFLDTTASYKVYLTRKMPVTRKSDGKQMELDYIIGNKDLELEVMEGAHRELNFVVSNLIHTRIQYITNPFANKDAALDIIPPWQNNTDYWYKVDVLKEVLSVDEEEAGIITDQYDFYEGWCRISGEAVDKPALHLFQRVDENNYRYVKSVLVKSNDDQCEYIPAKNVDAIKFKHYYLKDEPDSESGIWLKFHNTGCLEEDFCSVYDDEMYWYSSDVLEQLSINTMEASTVEGNPQKYGYYITADPILSGDSIVLLNENGAALQGNSYEQLPEYKNVS